MDAYSAYNKFTADGIQMLVAKQWPNLQQLGLSNEWFIEGKIALVAKVPKY